MFSPLRMLVGRVALLNFRMSAASSEDIRLDRERPLNAGSLIMPAAGSLMVRDLDALLLQLISIDNFLILPIFNSISYDSCERVEGSLVDCKSISSESMGFEFGSTSTSCALVSLICSMWLL